MGTGSLRLLLLPEHHTGGVHWSLALPPEAEACPQPLARSRCVPAQRGAQREDTARGSLGLRRHLPGAAGTGAAPAPLLSSAAPARAPFTI